LAFTGVVCSIEYLAEPRTWLVFMRCAAPEPPAALGNDCVSSVSLVCGTKLGGALRTFKIGVRRMSRHALVLYCPLFAAACG